jgi:putative hydrolase of the HAD superfamily
MKLTQFKALTFDCYGTLIDWESGMFEALKPLTSKLAKPLSRDEILAAHARHESSQELVTPAKRYSELLAVVAKRLAEEWGVPASWDECLAYGNSIKNWPAFPDSADALAYLKKHYKLAILSNVDNQSFAASNKNIGSYKPAQRNFDYMLDKLTSLGVEKGDILHTAESLFHDHRPANEFGIANCWIFRRHDKQGFGATMNPGDMPRYDFRFNSMADLAAAHRAELKS